jgi:ElaB/YqjD/DUF883 family membrane-anchored ribosome-binding protein
VVSDIEAVMKAAARTTNTYVRENPWPSIGMAAGAALIVGLLINRRRETDHG